MHCMSGGASFCACIVTETNMIRRKRTHTPLVIYIESTYIKQLISLIKHKIEERETPITSQVDLGNTIPVLGLTQYFFGFVVFTYSIPMSVAQESKLQIPRTQKSTKSRNKNCKIESECSNSTLKATWLSVLLDNCREHEICFLNSTFFFNSTNKENYEK